MNVYYLSFLSNRYNNFFNNINNINNENILNGGFSFDISHKTIDNIFYNNFLRAEAYDDKEKRKKTGIYRVKYEDVNDLDKKGNPKIKFKYYYSKNNEQVTLKDLERINKLGLAPAYEDVWVSGDENSKIQATGFDVKGRKQYRYHPEHIKDAGDDKFVRLFKFIKAIPKLDEAMEKDLQKEVYSKERTISIMLQIVQELNMRVGKECYAQQNKSYGITSLKKSHIKIDNEKLVAKFNFKAKSNKQVSYTLNNHDIVKELILLYELPGEKLFQYKSSSGNIIKVNDTDLNKYIQDNMGKSFTCKDFRTYAANFYFIKALLAETRKRTPTTQKIIKKNLSLAQENTAFYLRHTKSISKKSYTMELIRNMYVTDTQYFIENKNKKPITVLIDLLKKFKEELKKKIWTKSKET
jgi:DNA topoisomerase-1